MDMFGRKRYQMMDVNIDEETLKEIADISGGAYFQATDNASLSSIYEQIDRLEKTVIEETQYEKKYEEFFPLALIAISLLGMEWLVRRFVLPSSLVDV